LGRGSQAAKAAATDGYQRHEKEVVLIHSIADKAPELARLQDVVTKLEQEVQDASGRVAQLEIDLQSAHEDDLLRKAKALNEGRRVPKPREPEAKGKLEGATRRLEVLQRRLQLAQADVARYISENAEDLARLVSEAKVAKAREVSELAGPLARALHEYQLPDADMRALEPYLEAPQEENTGVAQPSISVWGPQNRRTAFGEQIAGQTIGQVEAIANELAGLAARYEQDGTTIVGDASEADEDVA
jgi:hypothetical protein